MTIDTIREIAGDVMSVATEDERRAYFAGDTATIEKVHSWIRAAVQGARLPQETAEDEVIARMRSVFGQTT